MFVCRTKIVVAFTFLGIVSEAGELQVVSAQKYCCIFLCLALLLLCLLDPSVCIKTFYPLAVLVSVLYLKTLVHRWLLCWMGLPTMLLPSDRGFLSQGTVEFLAIAVQAKAYYSWYCTALYATFFLTLVNCMLWKCCHKGVVLVYN